jgi:hypothetical protein
MDAERFDRFAKSLATRTSRRRLAGGLAALGVVGSVLGPARTEAQGAYGLLDGSAPTTEASDPTCKGEVALNNRRCRAHQCTSNRNCFCAETVNGDKKCVNLRDVRCPRRDECDGNGDCRGGEVCIKVGGCCGNRRRNDCVPLCR